MSARVEMFDQVTRYWLVDVDGLCSDFGDQLLEDGVDLGDDQAVADAAWDAGVREPYFELQHENDEASFVIAASSAAGKGPRQ